MLFFLDWQKQHIGDAGACRDSEMFTVLWLTEECALSFASMLVTCLLEEKGSVTLLQGKLITWDFMVTGSSSGHHYLSPQVRLVSTAPSFPRGSPQHRLDGSWCQQFVSVYQETMLTLDVEITPTPFLAPLWLMIS